MRMGIGRQGFLAMGLAVLSGCSASDAERTPAAARPDSAADSTAQAPPPAGWLGQTVTYTRRPGDTLRYRDVAFASLRVIGPDGDRAVNRDHAAVLGLTFLTPDTARGWYESLEVTLIAPEGRRTPTTDSLVGQPFTLLFGPRGRVETLVAPAVAIDTVQIREPTLVFAGFFPPLPADPLEIGLEWSDSLSTTVPGAPSRTVRLESVGRYTAVEDAVLDGESAVVITYERDLKLTSEGGGAPGDSLSLEGEEHGRFLFAPESGRMLSGEYAGKLRGQSQSGAGSGRQGAARRQFYEYRGTTTLIKNE